MFGLAGVLEKIISGVHASRNPQNLCIKLKTIALNVCSLISVGIPWVGLWFRRMHVGLIIHQENGTFTYILLEQKF